MPRRPPLPARKMESSTAAEAYGFSPEFMDYVRNIPIQPERGSAVGRALLEGRAVHIPDVKADPEYTLVEGAAIGRLPHGSRRSDVARGRSNRRAELDAFGSAAVHRETDRAGHRHLLTKPRLRLRTCVCSKAWRPARANWRSRLRICAPHRTVWCRHRSSPRSVSSPLESRTRSRTHSISSTISRGSRPN